MDKFRPKGLEIHFSIHSSKLILKSSCDFICDILEKILDFQKKINSPSVTMQTQNGIANLLKSIHLFTELTALGAKIYCVASCNHHLAIMNRQPYPVGRMQCRILQSTIESHRQLAWEQLRGAGASANPRGLMWASADSGTSAMFASW